MSKPVAIVDPHWRQLDELFSDRALSRLRELCDCRWMRDEPMPHNAFDSHLPDASFVVQATPTFDEERLAKAPTLKAIIEVSGAFPASVDYDACAARNIEVLCCAPGFRQSVAEMAVAMALAGARGLVDEHERFRRGDERWLADNTDTDFTLFGATVGFVGYGSIAREITRLLAPFGVSIVAYDPWLKPEVAQADGVRLADLPTVMAEPRCVFVTAAPTSDNHGLVSADLISQMRRGALLLIISRSHLVDFDAVTEAALKGHIRVATDVFPEEPLAADHPIRRAPGTILSPHRAAAVKGGRQLIGDMIVDDVAAMIDGRLPERLQRAAVMPVDKLRRSGDAKKVGALRDNREKKAAADSN